MSEDVKGILKSTLYCVVATVASDEAPQSVPLRFAYDDSCIYFRSSPNSEHSTNLLINPRVSITIFDTTQSVKGAVYIHSSAEKLEGTGKEHAMAVFNERFNNPPDQWVDTAYYKVSIGKIDENKSLDKMFYFQECSA